MPKRRMRTAAQIAASKRNLEKARKTVRLRNKAKMASTKGTSLFIAKMQGINIGSQSATKAWDKADLFWSLSQKGAKITGKKKRRKQEIIAYGSGKGASTLYHAYRPDRGFH